MVPNPGEAQSRTSDRAVRGGDGKGKFGIDYLDGELAEMRAELAVTDARLDHARSITAAYEERTGATEPA